MSCSIETRCNICQLFKGAVKNVNYYTLSRAEERREKGGGLPCANYRGPTPLKGPLWILFLNKIDIMHSQLTKI